MKFSYLVVVVNELIIFNQSLKLPTTLTVFDAFMMWVYFCFSCYSMMLIFPGKLYHPWGAGWKEIVRSSILLCANHKIV